MQSTYGTFTPQEVQSNLAGNGSVHFSHSVPTIPTVSQFGLPQGTDSLPSNSIDTFTYSEHSGHSALVLIVNSPCDISISAVKASRNFSVISQHPLRVPDNQNQRWNKEHSGHQMSDKIAELF